MNTNSDKLLTIRPTTPPYILEIRNSGPEALVTLHNDGTMEFGPNYTPTEAARIFWEAVASMCPYKTTT